MLDSEIKYIINNCYHVLATWFSKNTYTRPTTYSALGLHDLKHLQVYGISHIL